MTLFAIRDDDTSGWTEPEDLESLYRAFWDRGIPVSLSVIPQSVEQFHPGDWQRYHQGTKRRPVHDNERLVAYLHPLIRASQVDIMLHGFDHVYTAARSERSPAKPASREWTNELRAQTPGSQIIWRGEYAWKDAARLSRETAEGKAYLESLLDCRIRVFVPPSNQIGARGIRAVWAAGMNLSGIIGRRFDRPFSAGYVQAYLKRWMFRLSNGRPFPHVLDFGTHKELVAYAMTSAGHYDRLRKTLAFCSERQASFVIAVHYWELLRDADLRERFIRLCHDALEMGYTPATVAECLEKS
jgi:hypothetical protein